MASGTTVEAYDWNAMAPRAPEAPPAPAQPAAQAAPVVEPHAPAASATVERDAFALGYAQGERAGADAAAVRGEAMLRRLGDTLQELTTLRAEMIRRTERQMVQLALAMAKRIVQREVSVDRALLVGMARAALDRLGDYATATIRLHPDDHALVAGGLGAAEGLEQVSVVVDPTVSRGGCRVVSDFGFMDVSPHAQFDELARAVLEDEAQTVPVAVPVAARTLDAVSS